MICEIPKNDEKKVLPRNLAAAAQKQLQKTNRCPDYSKERKTSIAVCRRLMDAFSLLL